jgi:hypothetical protein
MEPTLLNLKISENQPKIAEPPKIVGATGFELSQLPLEDPKPEATNTIPTAPWWRRKVSRTVGHATPMTASGRPRLTNPTYASAISRGPGLERVGRFIAAVLAGASCRGGAENDTDSRDNGEANTTAASKGHNRLFSGLTIKPPSATRAAATPC